MRGSEADLSVLVRELNRSRMICGESILGFTGQFTENKGVSNHIVDVMT